MNIVRINPYLKYKSNINLEKADISKTSQKKLAKMSDFCDDLQDLNYEFIGLLGYVTNTLQMRTILLDTANLLRDYTDSSGNFFCQNNLIIYKWHLFNSQIISTICLGRLNRSELIMKDLWLSEKSLCNKESIWFVVGACNFHKFYSAIKLYY